MKQKIQQVCILRKLPINAGKGPKRLLWRVIEKDNNNRIIKAHASHADME